MSCHVLKGMGFEVGPDLAILRGKEPDYWLKNILDPNAVIEPRFVSYEIETRDDRSISGVIKSETASSLTLVAGNGVTETISRSDIKSIRASSLSLMPEGLDQAMTLQEMADLLAFVIPRNPSKRFTGNDPALVVPAKGEILMLPAARAEIFGDRIAFEEPFKNIGMWHGTDDYVAWTLQVNKAGRYDVYIDFACANDSAGNPFRISIGSQSITGRVSGTGSAWDKYVQKNVGSVQLEPGQHRLTFRADAALRGALIDLRTVALCPSGSAPTWPSAAAASAVAQSELLLRDAPSIARYPLDPAQSTSAREAAIRANPQYAADFIVEMTRGLKPGPAEYERIPWIWRVAIACGKRNEPREIKRVLDVSLPAIGEPLRDWQSVVIGGGIINGLSQRGIWPAQTVQGILADDPAMLKRWTNSLELAAAMTDDTKVPAGTRYDALRMLGMESWEKRGPQLLRYLKDRNAELQMGAVSGLADMPFPQATEALVSALDHLKGHNRELALDALLRDEARATALLDRATAQRWQPAALGTNRLAKLREHANPKLRARAQEQFQR